MLRHTFCHIPGIGFATEKKLWNCGVTDWHKWKDPVPVKVPASTRHDAAIILDQSLTALDRNNPSFFTSRLASSESWRIFSLFRNSTAYLDIETTGLDEAAEITTIALYDGNTVFTYVNGINLDRFVDDIYNYSVIVSYNGKSFDIPFIENYFRISLDHAQIDLRYVLAKLGFKGGLKGCEKMVGMNRGNLAGVDGYFAVLLWREYLRNNDRRVLDTLLAYNIEDTVNLERLAVEAYNRNVQMTPFGADLALTCPPSPPNPYVADNDIIALLKRTSAQNRGW
ncbi:ribonuclease H-like domain-containing protein [Desulforhopalus singaporensis]|uniref:YprB ribonuclease H-like domain-containing protein n=1 Tax=Desulforhopalus singaporensis TaxID=91360 RepID=A0A1H0TB71_9BACT|nr:ribonuclease H-like domain-containing protein [Desulforhopalus singaporensis]SDP50848.1 hypothetical protein SAMN05660330_02981 [Desulforhopalus singaporensis]